MSVTLTIKEIKDFEEYPEEGHFPLGDKLKK